MLRTELRASIRGGISLVCSTRIVVLSTFYKNLIITRPQVMH